MAARGRRPLGSPDARRAVLDAARELFAELGYERTTMRAVGARAGVDPALIYHYFGDKDGLLSAAIEIPADLAAALAGVADDAGRAGEELVERVISLLEYRQEIRERMLATLRTALSHDHAAQLLRDRIGSVLLAAFGSVLANDRRELRAALIASQMGGLMLARYILKVPGAAAASPTDLAQAVGPVIQHYLTATIGPAVRPHPPAASSPGNSLPRALRRGGTAAVDDDRLAGDERIRADQAEDRPGRVGRGCPAPPRTPPRTAPNVLRH